ncbi:endo-1,3-1,4-beta-glycanase ExsH [Abditibacteriota bacterium]|nr:endo-1,3-1,4-beta-glycanase ExsH [Abditibacteriota bacterium]
MSHFFSPRPFGIYTTALLLTCGTFAAAAPAPLKAVAVPQTITSPLGHPMSLAFDDEFDAVKDRDGQPYIDRSKWQTTFWQGSSQRTLWGNLEAQYYVDKDYNGEGSIHPEANGTLNPFSFETPGILTISAWKTPKELWGKFYMGEQRPFSSGLLISDKRFSFQYGYMVGRFKLSSNRGAWPAFWILGDDSSKPLEAEAHEWGPEVDAFEFFGHRPTKHSGGIHGRDGDKASFTFGMNEVGIDLTKEFHTWGFEWDKDTCVWTLDGKEWARGNTPASLNRPMYLLLNLAVGGQWYSEEISNQLKTLTKPWEVDETTMPWKMQCDYVRVYRSQDADTQVKEVAAKLRSENNHLTREVWTDVPGTSIAQIPVDKKPNAVMVMREFELPTNIGINFGTRVRGYITAPTTGDYIFWIAGDDNCELRISPTDNAAGSVKCASVSETTGYTGWREWNKTPEQKSAPIHLEAGKRYFIEALQKQDVGGDNLSVGWLKPGETGDKPSEVVPASVLSPYLP